MENNLPPKLLIETDLFSDVDDAGALAVALALAQQGETEVAAIGVNTPSRWGYQAANVICAHYARAEIPVGALLPLDDSVFERDYAKYISEHFPGADRNHPPRPAAAVFREVLARLPDGSATFVSIGFFANLLAVLQSPPDRVSPLSGADLLRRKLRETVVMGGAFPEGKEFNLAQYPDQTQAFLAQWPGPITFVGFEVGVDVITGRGFGREQTGEHPVAAAYQQYSGGDGRSSWDLIAINTAVRGPGKHFDLSVPGRLLVSDNGENAWSPDPAGPHRYLLRTADAQSVAAELDALLIAPVRP